MNKKVVLITLCAILGVICLILIGFKIGQSISNKNSSGDKTVEKEEKKEEKIEEKEEEKEKKEEDNKPEEVKKVTITFDSNGGSNVASIEYTCGEKISLPKEPTQDGYTFKYWEKDDGTVLIDKSTLECKDRTVRAIWEKIKSYHCPEGYTLNEKECYKPVASYPSDECPEGTYEAIPPAENKLCYDLDDSKKVKSFDKCNAREVEVRGEKVVAEGYAENGQCYYGDLKIDNSSECSKEKGYWKDNKCWVEKRDGVNFGCPEGYKIVFDTYYMFHIHKTLYGSACYPIVPKIKCEDSNAVIKENGCYLIKPAEYY